MRGVLLLVLLLLGACAGRSGGGLRAGMPGLDVADAALRAGSPQIALQVADRMLTDTPDDTAVLVVKGDALTALGRLDEAADVFSRVIRIDPRSIGGNVGLGRIRLGSDPAAAEALFLTVLNRDPRNTIALTDLGIARDLQGRHTDAQTAYRQALGVDPDLRAAQVNLALSMAMSGQGEGAMRLIRPIAEAPNAPRKLRHDYAAVLALSGRQADAERILSADLNPTETRQVLAAYAARSGGGAAALLDDAAPVGAPQGRGAPGGGASGGGAPSGGAPAGGAAAGTGIAAGGGIAAGTGIAAGGGGSIQVQLSAAVSEDAAYAEWQRLQEKLPAALQGHQPLVQRAEHDGKPFWRLRTGGFATPADARGFCEKLRGAGANCVVIGV